MHKKGFIDKAQCGYSTSSFRSRILQKRRNLASFSPDFPKTSKLMKINWESFILCISEEGIYVLRKAMREETFRRIFPCFPNRRRCCNKVVEEENKQPEHGTEMKRCGGGCTRASACAPRERLFPNASLSLLSSLILLMRALYTITCLHWYVTVRIGIQLQNVQPRYCAIILDTNICNYFKALLFEFDIRMKEDMRYPARYFPLDCIKW